MNYLIYFYLCHFLIAQDLVPVAFRSTVKSAQIYMDGIEIKIPSTLQIQKKAHVFRVKFENVDTLFSYNVISSFKIIINNEFKSYLNFYPGRSLSSLNTNQILNYQISGEKISQELNFQKKLAYELALPSNKKNKLVLKNINYNDTEIIIELPPFVSFDVEPVFKETIPFHNSLVEIKQGNRKKTKLVIASVLGASTLFAFYKTISHKSKSNEDFQNYLKAVSESDINGYYISYNDNITKYNTFLTLGIISSVIVSYVLFFETYTDLSEQLIDENRLTIKTSQTSESFQIGFSLNF